MKRLALISDIEIGGLKMLDIQSTNNMFKEIIAGLVKSLESNPRQTSVTNWAEVNGKTQLLRGHY